MISVADVGLKLNSCEQAFRGAVLDFFRAAEKEKRLKKAVKASKRTGEQTNWKDRVPSLTRSTLDLADAIVNALDDAMKTRDQYLIAAYEEMDRVAHVRAEARGLQVQDVYSGPLLV